MIKKSSSISTERPILSDDQSLFLTVTFTKQISPTLPVDGASQVASNGASTTCTAGIAKCILHTLVAKMFSFTGT